MANSSHLIPDKATNISVSPTGNLSSSNVQDALVELQTDIDGLGGGSGTGDLTAVAEYDLTGLSELEITGLTNAGECMHIFLSRSLNFDVNNIPICQVGNPGYITSYLSHIKTHQQNNVFSTSVASTTGHRLAGNNVLAGNFDLMGVTRLLTTTGGSGQNNILITESVYLNGDAGGNMEDLKNISRVPADNIDRIKFIAQAGTFTSGKIVHIKIAQP